MATVRFITTLSFLLNPPRIHFRHLKQSRKSVSGGKMMPKIWLGKNRLSTKSKITNRSERKSNNPDKESKRKSPRVRKLATIKNTWTPNPNNRIRSAQEYIFRRLRKKEKQYNNQPTR